SGLSEPIARLLRTTAQVLQRDGGTGQGGSNRGAQPVEKDVQMAVDEGGELATARTRNRPGELGDGGEQVTAFDVQPELAGPTSVIHHPIDRRLEPHADVDDPGIGKSEDAAEH